MSDTDRKFRRCETCKKYHWSNLKCCPIFYFKHKDYGDDFEEVRADDFEDAAEKFVEKYNDEGTLLDYGKQTVIISDGKTEKTFVVYAEASVNYYVTEKTKEA